MNKLIFYKLDRNHLRSERKFRIRLIMMNSKGFRIKTFMKTFEQTSEVVRGLTLALVDVGKALSLLREIKFPTVSLTVK